MKAFLSLILLCLIYFSVAAQEKTLEFSTLSHDEIFAKAKADNKSIMLFFHFEKCGACIAMIEETFIEANVIEYYKDNFISMSIDTEKGDGIALKEKYNITLQPVFLFFNAQGELVHKYMGFMKGDKFIEESKKAVENLMTSTKADRMYKEGNRNIDFLIEYNYISDRTYTLDSNIIKNTFEGIKAADYKKEHVLKYIFTLHDYRGYKPMTYYSDKVQFFLDNTELLYKYFDTTVVHNKLLWILNDTQEEIIKKKDEAAFKKALSFIEKYEQKNSMMYRIEHLEYSTLMIGKYIGLRFANDFYKAFGDKNKYAAAKKDYEAAFWNDTEFLNTMAWLNAYYGQNISKKDFETFKKYALRAIELENNFSHNLTYAWLLYKSNKKKEMKKAKTQLQKTYALANDKQKESEEAKELEKLLEKI